MAKNSNKKEKRERVVHSELRKAKEANFKHFPRRNEDPVIAFFEQIHQACYANWYMDYRYKEEAKFVFNRVNDEKMDLRERKALNRLVGLGKRHHLIIAGGEQSHNKKVLACFVHLAKMSNYWKREPDKFIPKYDKNIIENVQYLVNHLLAEYFVPLIFLEDWFDHRSDTKETKLHKEWYINLGYGENIRKQKGLPYKMTKKQAHLMSEVPPRYNLMEGFRWAQLKGLGFDDTTIMGVMELPISKDFSNDEFWMTVFHFFKNNPFLETYRYREIYDYIVSMKYPVAGRDAEMPDFSMKGRTATVLLAQVEEWHTRINARRVAGRNTPVTWPKSEIKDWQNISKGVVVRIVELNSVESLYKEGKEMKHCVGSYAYSCSKGGKAVFSIATYDKGEGDKKGDYSVLTKRLSTIEVDLNSMQIVQVRANCNRLPECSTLNLIRKWAKSEGITMSQSIGGDYEV